MASRLQKTNKKQSAKSRPQARVWNWTHVHLIFYQLVIAFFLSLSIVGVLYLYISLDIPDISSLAGYRPAVTTVILDDQGEVVERVFSKNRTIVPLSKMPDTLAQAFVAAEDARFYQHSGVDVWSILRALIHNIKKGGRGQGGSTITQQVARSLLLSPEKTYTRKIKEAILAYRIDKALSKEEILHIYLNEIYLGEGAYGVEAAAQVYFGKSVGKLNLAEISILAGLPQAPSRYSPFKHYKLAKKRQIYVLNRMAEDGYITPTSARTAYKTSLFWGPPFRVAKESRYYLQHVKNYVVRKYGSTRFRSGGLTIYTVLDRDLQKEAAKAVRNGVASWRKRHRGAAKESPQAALVAMEVRTGNVKAVAGGTDFSRSQFNRATQARRQPGSAFKPLIYAAALEAGLTPATLLVDEPIQLPGAESGRLWEPRNFSGTFQGLTTLRDGLVYSGNIVTIKLLQEVGIRQVVDLAKDMGISAKISPDLSLALGSSGLSLMDLTAAYAVFAGKGRYLRPTFVRKIVDRDGKVLEENRPSPERALDSLTAFQVTHLLKRVIEEGTGKRARGLFAPSAGKTGTTDSNMDAWFIGFTPTLATGVWLGFDEKNSLGEKETGGRAAAPVWLDFMKKAEKYLDTEDFEVPEGITMLPMNNETGEVLTRETADTHWEAFRRDSLPVERKIIGEKKEALDALEDTEL
ncbi:MAG: PBP1A family penicillin-binding protein [Desulfobulbaceae bacterium]|nr:PBP1A family penicillin-binding protein [Desulfobulbaceae bacterium]